MSTSEWLPGILLGLDWIIRLVALGWIPSRTTPAAARSWLLLVGFLPFVGLPLYMAFGHPWLSRQRIERQSEASQAIREDQATQAALRWTPEVNTVADEIVPLVERQGDFMPTHGNAVTLLPDYDESLDSLLRDIESAEKRVHLLYYLMFDDNVGDRMVAALQRACWRGVKCRLLLDAIGAKRGLRRYARTLAEAGVEVHDMLPGGLRWRRSGRADLRNHRKIAIIDSDVGYIGSQNLACREFVPGFPNRELVARVQGPVVAHLEAVFASDWYLETGQDLPMFSAGPVHCEDVAVQLLPSGPAYPFPNAGDTVNALIHLAKRRLVLTTPYFVPDDGTVNALRIAALSNVDVQLILSASNNQPLTAWAQHAYYEELLSCGVKIALYQPNFLHAKHLSVDDEVALIGSINLDMRSFALNAEIGMLCYNRDIVAQMQAIETQYLAHSEQLSLEIWRQRAPWRRSLEGIARLADSFL